MAFAARAKIIKPTGGEEASEFEKSISQALLDLEINSDLKAQLRELYITAAREVEVAGKKAIVIFVPVPQRKAFQKIQPR